jgi:hypothetical protein
MAFVSLFSAYTRKLALSYLHGGNYSLAFKIILLVLFKNPHLDSEKPVLTSRTHSIQPVYVYLKQMTNPTEMFQL